ncbi:MAG: hypothetical protein H7Z40_21210 [Phycisphaerae bacterium]|nr:hypothetical protein [Gemmatimonadaceae bacterium]
MPRTLSRLFSAAVSVAAFTSVAPAVSAAQLTDSAGIRIYDYRTSAVGGVAFVVDNSPVISVSASDGSDSSALGTQAIALLRNGGFAVGVAFTRNIGVGPNPKAFQTHEVRVFDARSHFVRRMGQYGPNLGQLPSAPQFISEAPNGELLVSAGRPDVTRFKPTGELVRGARFGNINRLAFGAGILADQSIVVGVEQGGVNIPVDVPGAVVARAEFRYARYDTTGAKVEELPIVRHYYFFSNGPGRPPAPGVPWPYSASDPVVAGGRNIWRLDIIKWELQNFDNHGRLISITRPTLPERLKNAVLGQISKDGVSGAHLIADDEGRLWMASGEPRSAALVAAGQKEYTVYDTTGAQLGTVAMPDRLSLRSVQRLTLLGMTHETQSPVRNIVGLRVRPFAAGGR